MSDPHYAWPGHISYAGRRSFRFQWCGNCSPDRRKPPSPNATDLIDLNAAS